MVKGKAATRTRRGAGGGSDGSRRFGDDLTNSIAAARRTRPRQAKTLTKLLAEKAGSSEDRGNDTDGYDSDKTPNRAVANAKTSTKKGKRTHRRQSRLPLVKEKSSESGDDKSSNEGDILPELPYKRIRTYSKLPDKQWAFVQRPQETFPYGPLNIDDWLQKERQQTRGKLVPS
ncbi:unnamed protein product (mitochondrion) [Plasmodiophora brassicae]|uniref:Uncharacterized protein n=1 Tax=Plasmodiophora brassicae TaxID=37360 RepID=A0A0G4J032_PLABS|nr:hypothetical protein PBRA_001743 [Plasmodiophora brassicae]SPQ93827.1 unnamed protein product [Plasmodiophora brassicae]